MLPSGDAVTRGRNRSVFGREEDDHHHVGGGGGASCQKRFFVRPKERGEEGKKS